MSQQETESKVGSHWRRWPQCHNRKQKAIWAATEEDDNNVTTGNRKQSGQPLKKMTTMFRQQKAKWAATEENDNNVTTWKQKTKWAAIEEDDHNVTTGNRKQYGQPLKKMTIMSQQETESKVGTGQPLKKMTTMLQQETENKVGSHWRRWPQCYNRKQKTKWAAIEEDDHIVTTGKQKAKWALGSHWRRWPQCHNRNTESEVGSHMFSGWSQC